MCRWEVFGSLSVRSIGSRHSGELGFPFITVDEELLLVVQEFLAGYVMVSRLPHAEGVKVLTFCGVLGIRRFDNGVDGTALLTETTVDALGHVNVVASGPSAAVLTLLCLDGDCLGGANGLAQLASNATLFSGRVAAQGVLATEARTDGALLERVVDGVTFDRVNNWCRGCVMRGRLTEV